MSSNFTVQNPALGHVSTTVASFMAQVYGWMTAGLFLTAAVAFVVTSNLNLLFWIATNDWVIPLLFITELVVVVILSAFVEKLHPAAAAALFLFYSLLNGVFFGVLVTLYTLASVFLAFGATAGTFAIMSVYGFVTKSDLTRWGNLALMGLFGLILGIILNIFLKSSGLDWLLTFIGIGIFIILIAYDTQKLKHYSEAASQSANPSKYAVMGALSLYLDFINLFIRLLAIFGKRR